jgi:hypothetical protein
MPGATGREGRDGRRMTQERHVGALGVRSSVPAGAEWSTDDRSGTENVLLTYPKWDMTGGPAPRNVGCSEPAHGAVSSATQRRAAHDHSGGT